MEPICRLAGQRVSPQHTDLPRPDYPDDPSTVPQKIPPVIKARVLIIDDEAPLRDMLRRCLTPVGCECIGAETAGEAMDILQTQPIDLILLDLMLPDVNGYSFFELLQEARIGTPVVIISGCTSKDALQLGWELGAVDYVTKPFNPTELIFRVRRALDKMAVS